MARDGVFDPAEMGMIGSAFFIAYAVGKLLSGLLADRVNVRMFMVVGLAASGAVNLLLGFTTAFWAFLVFWCLNGCFQSFGAPSSVVTLSRWFHDGERGTFYGFWSASHNLGEAMTFVGTAMIVAAFGWTWGFRAAGIACLAMSVILWILLPDRPRTYGLREVCPPASHPAFSMTRRQLSVLRNGAVWIIAGASACFYVTRYAVNSWGIFFLEVEKGYSTAEASALVSLNAVAGILGTLTSGLISDHLFQGRRNVPALLFGILYAIATAQFVLGPADPLLDGASMCVFGVALGVLLVYLGGLIAVDLCSKEVSGTALGVVGIASYVGAAVQDVISGWLVESTHVNGTVTYDFHAAGMLWIGAAIASFLLPALLWNKTANAH